MYSVDTTKRFDKDLKRCPLSLYEGFEEHILPDK